MFTYSLVQVGRDTAAAAAAAADSLYEFCATQAFLDSIASLGADTLTIKMLTDDNICLGTRGNYFFFFCFN